MECGKVTSPKFEMVATDWLNNQKTSKIGQERTFLMSCLAILGSRTLSFVLAKFCCHYMWGTGSAASLIT